MKETVLDSDFLILNRLANLYSARRFQEEIDRNSLNASLVTPEWLIDNLSRFESRDASPAILYRQGEHNFWPTQARLSECRLHVINSPSAFMNARDKWVTHQNWLRYKIPAPATFSFSQWLDEQSRSITSSVEDIPSIVKNIYSFACDKLGTPFMLKKRFSIQGRGVFLISNPAELEKVWLADTETFQQSDSREINYFKREFPADPPVLYTQLQRWIFQKSIRESLGSDVRCFYLPDSKYSMERKNPGSYLSNLHQGGNAEVTQLNEIEEKYVEKAHSISGLHYSGIDFIRSDNGPMFLEINPSPGFEGIETAHKISIAAQLIDIVFTQKA